MARNIIGFDDDVLRSLIARAAELLGRGDMNAEERRVVERRYAVYISEAIHRIRERLR